jgi:hypothetical protein
MDDARPKGNPARIVPLGGRKLEAVSAPFSNGAACTIYSSSSLYGAYSTYRGQPFIAAPPQWPRSRRARVAYRGGLYFRKFRLGWKIVVGILSRRLAKALS